MLTESDILEALRVCYDPELQINIVDLGRVDRIHIEADSEAPGPTPRAHVIIDLFPSHEEQDSMLAALITNRLLGIFAISRAHVTFADEPWTPDRMNSSARAQRSKQQGLIQLGD
ncbi:metal-sulfur cluster assembly factor [Terriglobus sp.]|uniref:metal-sulfur cluster assembly factor n=1 Tax=Terriglobus sp. TaxID=1889013 RepID=UPI003B00CD21